MSSRTTLPRRVLLPDGIGIPNPDAEPYLTAGRVAVLLGCTPRTVHADVAAGRIPAVTVGRLVRIPTRIFLERFGLLADDAPAAVTAP